MPRIEYAPLKSVAFGHATRLRNPRKAWEATQAFLREHTIAELGAPLNLTLSGPSQWTDPAVVRATRADAERTFGAATRISGESFNWELPVAILPEALEFALADDRRPKQSVGPVHLYLWYSFHWKTMPNPQLLRPVNRLAAMVGARRLFLQPVFIFEASDVDVEFIAKLRELEAMMPFAPNDRYYYRVEAKKSGRGQKLVRLHKGWKGLV
jgi:hypothetical protein